MDSGIFGEDQDESTEGSFPPPPPLQDDDEPVILGHVVEGDSAKVELSLGRILISVDAEITSRKSGVIVLEVVKVTSMWLSEFE